MKKRIIVLLLVLSIVFTGCGTSPEVLDDFNTGSSSNSNNSDTSGSSGDGGVSDSAAENDDTAADAGSILGQGDLTISFTSDREATFTLTCPSFTGSFEDLNDADADAEGFYELYSWEVNFGDFSVCAYIPKMGKQSYTIDDLQCDIRYIQMQEDGYAFSYGLTNLEYTLSGDTLTIQVVLPNESDLSFVEGADIAEIAAYTFSQVQEYTLLEKEMQTVLYELYYTGAEFAENIPVLTQVFPDEVYANGFTLTTKDAAWFAPSTENYALYDGTIINPDGMLAADKKVMLVFDAAGTIIDGYSRYGYYTGSESTADGWVPTKADEATMQMYSEQFMQSGYSLSSSESLAQGEFAIDGHYLYLRWNQETLDRISDYAINYNYLSSAKWVQNGQSEILNGADAADYGSGYSLFYMSEFVLDDTLPLFENYCTPEDFYFLSMITMLSDDYYIAEYPTYADICFFDESGKGIKQITVQNFASTTEYDYALSNSYQKVEGSSTILYHTYDCDASYMKSSYLMVSQSTIQNYAPQSYSQCMSDNGFAIYMSKPWAGN